MQPYHSLVVWRQAHEFVRALYAQTEKFPSHERYGLTSQLRRAAISVAANIVEGHAKHSRKDFLRFLDITDGSLAECAYLLELARDLGYVTMEEHKALESLRAKTGYLLNNFIRGVKQRQDY